MMRSPSLINSTVFREAVVLSKNDPHFQKRVDLDFLLEFGGFDFDEGSVDRLVIAVLAAEGDSTAS